MTAEKHALVDRKHDRQHGGQIGCGLQENLALMQRLLHELPLLVVQLHDRLLQVPHTSMDKLSGF